MYIDIRYKYIVNIYIFANIINDTVIGSGRDNKLCKHSFVQVCWPKEQVTTCCIFQCFATAHRVYSLAKSG